MGETPSWVSETPRKSWQANLAKEAAVGLLVVWPRKKTWLRDCGGSDSGDFDPVQEGDFSVVPSFVHRKWARRFPWKNPPECLFVHGAEFHVVAVPPDADSEPVRTFQSFTGDLHRMSDWLKTCHITTVAMESTGVYWLPAFEILEAAGFNVILVNARDAKNVPGRKTDVNDAQWLQKLHSFGLLRASFRRWTVIFIVYYWFIIFWYLCFFYILISVLILLLLPSEVSYRNINAKRLIALCVQIPVYGPRL